MSGYSWISVISLFCYLFLMGAFLAAEKNKKVIVSFMMLLVLMILWTGGSFAMRMQMWPSAAFWSQVSVTGIVMLMGGYYYFVMDFLEDRRVFWKYFWLAAFALLVVINALTGLFIPPPEVTQLPTGPQFVYHYDWHVYIVFAIIILCLAHLVMVVLRHCRGNPVVFHQLVPVLSGVGIMIAGHIVATLPIFAGFPLDILSGGVNAVCIFYALYRKRLFRLTLLFSQTNSFVISLALGVTIYSNFAVAFQNFAMGTMKLQYVHALILSTLVLILIISILHLCIKAFFNAVFVRSEQQQSDLIGQFSQDITRLLSVQDLLQKLTDTLQQALSVRRVFVLLRGADGEYRIAYTASPLEEKSFTLPKDHPLVSYFERNSKCILQREFARTTYYRGMWESEKKMLDTLGIECYVPLISENELIGVVMLSGKKEKGHLGTGDLSFLQSLSAICAIAVKNATMYERAVEAARKDELTGLINRKYFYELLDREFEKSRNTSIALGVLNIDDFRLYNQLYGSQAGNLALQRVAAILLASVDENSSAARISGKEFAVILPGYDIYSAKNLLENISRQIGDINANQSEGQSLSRLTVSGGVCAAPYMASTPKELLKNADTAVYTVKRSGKNAILMYTEEVYRRETQQMVHESGYSEHASTICALTAAIDSKDHYTFRHSQNVSYYAAELAEAAGMEPQLVEIAKEAGLLHDIGKISVREDVLKKSGPLTPEELALMRGHVDNGVNIIRYLPSLDYVIPAVLSHHERYDGQGYPRRLAGEEIPILGRVLCIADAFDAMTSLHSYKPPVPVREALEILEKEAGAQFDPALVPVFVDLVESGRLERRWQSPEESEEELDAPAEGPELLLPAKR